MKSLGYVFPKNGIDFVTRIVENVKFFRKVWNMKESKLVAPYSINMACKYLPKLLATRKNIRNIPKNTYIDLNADEEANIQIYAKCVATFMKSVVLSGYIKKPIFWIHAVLLSHCLNFVFVSSKPVYMCRVYGALSNFSEVVGLTNISKDCYCRWRDHVEKILENEDNYNSMTHDDRVFMVKTYDMVAQAELLRGSWENSDALFREYYRKLDENHVAADETIMMYKFVWLDCIVLPLGKVNDASKIIMEQVEYADANSKELDTFVEAYSSLSCNYAMTGRYEEANQILRDYKPEETIQNNKVKIIHNEILFINLIFFLVI